MGFLKKIFGKKYEYKKDQESKKDENKDDGYIINPYETTHFNYPFSPKITSFILKLIENGEKVYNHHFSIVVVMDEFHYALWNANYPYAWLSKCDKYYQIPVVREQKIQTSLWLPNPYEKVTVYEWKHDMLWNNLLPDPQVMYKFEKFCIDNGIIVDGDQNSYGPKLDTEFMDKVLETSKEKKE